MPKKCQCYPKTKVFRNSRGIRIYKGKNTIELTFLVDLSSKHMTSEIYNILILFFYCFGVFLS